MWLPVVQLDSNPEIFTFTEKIQYWPPLPSCDGDSMKLCFIAAVIAADLYVEAVVQLCSRGLGVCSSQIFDVHW